MDLRKSASDNAAGGVSDAEGSDARDEGGRKKSSETSPMSAARSDEGRTRRRARPGVVRFPRRGGFRDAFEIARDFSKRPGGGGLRRARRRRLRLGGTRPRPLLPRTPATRWKRGEVVAQTPATKRRAAVEKARGRPQHPAARRDRAREKSRRPRPRPAPGLGFNLEDIATRLANDRGKRASRSSTTESSVRGGAVATRPTRRLHPDAPALTGPSLRSQARDDDRNVVERGDVARERDRARCSAWARDSRRDVSRPSRTRPTPRSRRVVLRNRSGWSPSRIATSSRAVRTRPTPPPYPTTTSPPRRRRVCSPRRRDVVVRRSAASTRNVPRSSNARRRARGEFTCRVGRSATPSGAAGCARRHSIGHARSALVDVSGTRVVFRGG